MNNNNPDIKLKARLAALIFFTVCIPFATWSLSYVPSLIFVKDDAIATAKNLLTYEFIFRTAIAGHLISSIVFSFVIFQFYQLFRPFNKNIPKLMLIPVLMQLVIVLMLEVLRFASLMIINGDALNTIAVTQRSQYSFILLRMHQYGIGISQLFWGLSFLAFGILVYKTRFTPWFIGMLLLISGIGYVADCFAYILLQRRDYLLIRPLIKICLLGFGFSMLWIFFKGLKNRKNY